MRKKCSYRELLFILFGFPQKSSLCHRSKNCIANMLEGKILYHKNKYKEKLSLRKDIGWCCSIFSNRVIKSQMKRHLLPPKTIRENPRLTLSPRANAWSEKPFFFGNPKARTIWQPLELAMLSLNHALLAAAAVDCKAKDKPISFFFGGKRKPKKIATSWKEGFIFSSWGGKWVSRGDLGRGKWQTNNKMMIVNFIEMDSVSEGQNLGGLGFWDKWGWWNLLGHHTVNRLLGDTNQRGQLYWPQDSFIKQKVLWCTYTRIVLGCFFFFLQKSLIVESFFLSAIRSFERSNYIWETSAILLKYWSSFAVLGWLPNLESAVLYDNTHCSTIDRGGHLSWFDWWANFV